MPNEKHPKLKANPEEFIGTSSSHSWSLPSQRSGCGGAIDVDALHARRQGTKHMAIAKVLEWDHNILTKAAS